MAAPVSPLRRVMRSRDLRRLALAYVTMVIADLGTYIAILVYAYDRGGTGAVAFVAAIQLAPSALIAPLAAAAGDRRGPAVLLPRRYAALAASCALGAVVLLVDGPVAVAYLAAALISVIVAATRPLHRSLLPELADGPEDLTAANAVLSSAEGVGSLAAPLLAGVILAVTSVGVVFAVAAALLVPVAIGLATLHQHHDRSSGAPPVRVAGELRDGLRVIRQGAGARAALGGIVAINVAMGATRVLVVPLAVDALDAGDAAVGWLSAGLGVGLVLGGIGGGLLAGRAHLSRWVVQGLILWGAVLATVGMAPVVLIAVLAMALAATGAAIADLATRTLLQRLVPGPLLTRALGLAEAVFIGSTLVGSVLAAPLDAQFGVVTAFVIVGVATVLAALVSGLVLRRSERATAPPERQLGLLRMVPITRSLDPATLESLAFRLERKSVAPGERVISEGEIGDRFYIIERGAFTVGREAHTLAELGQGDFFGEVALLLDEPRNATVEARTAGEIWTLERADFLEALTGTPQAHGVAHSIATERRG